LPKVAGAGTDFDFTVDVEDFSTDKSTNMRVDLTLSGGAAITSISSTTRDFTCATNNGAASISVVAARRH